MFKIENLTGGNQSGNQRTLTEGFVPFSSYHSLLIENNHIPDNSISKFAECLFLATEAKITLQSIQGE
jgi:hypothetical protein